LIHVTVSLILLTSAEELAPPVQQDEGGSPAVIATWTAVVPALLNVPTPHPTPSPPLMLALAVSKPHDVVIEVAPAGNKFAVLKFTSADSEPQPSLSHHAWTVWVPPSVKVCEEGSIR
jgi:hypothetical protein